MMSLLTPAHRGATSINHFSVPPTRNSSFHLRTSVFHGAPILAFRRASPQLRLVCSSPRHGRSITCLFGGKAEMPEKNDGDASLWKSLENAMGNFKKNSIDDILREQMRQQELKGGGGSGSPPRGGGGGGEGSGDTEDEGLAGTIDEFLQVVFATLGFIFLYIYLIYGEEMTRLAKDYIKYLFGASASVRLKRAMTVSERFWRSMTRKKAVRRKDWLEQAILTTPTWWQNPEHLEQRMMPDDDD